MYISLVTRKTDNLIFEYLTKKSKLYSILNKEFMHQYKIIKINNLIYNKVETLKL